MRIALAAACGAALSMLLACTPPRAEAPAAPPPEAPPAAAAAPASVYSGTFAPISKTAESITADVTFEGATLNFGLGHTYVTQALPAGGLDAAAIFPGMAPAAVELRKVTDELVNAKAANGGLCGKGDAATHLLLAADSPDPAQVKTVAIAAFKGAAAPTPETAATALCGTFGYGR